jgi:diadenosine tetraphosphate (Ap4A) HIT family hydrolase
MNALGCKACAGTWPAADHRIADCGITVAYLFEDQYFPGWTVLVLKQHATELFELTQEERSRLIEEVNSVARALAEVFKPVKINYGLLGNQLPHIHWHVVPRLADDPAPLEAVWGHKHEAKRLAGRELAERIVSVQARLKREGN